MERIAATLAAVGVIAATPLTPAAHAQPPIVGAHGLCGNAANLADYIRTTYPAVREIGGVRPDRLRDHPSGHALDIMIGNYMALGDRILADIQSQSGRFGVRYTMWRVPQHYDHIHVTVN